MNALARAVNVENVEDIDPGIANLLRGMQRDRRWAMFPYGWWTEADGSYVIFDRGYRLICRKRQSGALEILPFARTGNPTRRTDNLWIDWVDQRWFYRGGSNHPARSEMSRMRVLGVVQRLRIRDEIIRRREAADREWSQRREYLRRAA